jgi:nucleoid-associated protein YgaU
MQCRCYLCSQLLAVLFTVLSVTISPHVGGAQTASSVTEQDIAGLIIATQEDRVSVSAGDTVILDQGQLQGVEAGDRYAVFQDGHTSVHPFSGHPIHVPREVIGELTVVRVYERTSTAQIRRSTREVNVGAPIAPLRAALARQPEDLPGQTDFQVQAQARLTQVTPCTERVRQTLQTAPAVGAKAADLADARGALASAELAVEQAHALLDAGEAERAANRLDNALADCLRAEELLQRTGVVTTNRAPAVQPERYAVQRGDTLWGISGREQIYHNPFMWPLIYKANSQQIHDPDRIFPRQILAIPRNYAPEEATAAIQRAKQRGAWNLRDSR